jgi:hypothetical protein
MLAMRIFFPHRQSGNSETPGTSRRANIDAGTSLREVIRSILLQRTSPAFVRRKPSVRQILDTRDGLALGTAFYDKELLNIPTPSQCSLWNSLLIEGFMARGSSTLGSQSKRVARLSTGAAKIGAFDNRSRKPIPGKHECTSV